MNANRNTNTVANMESINAVDALEPAPQVRPYHQAVHIHIHSIRKRLTDPDAVSGKAAIDGIVETGILRDDRPEYVQAVTFSQEQGAEEKTIITITEAITEEAAARMAGVYADE